MVRSGLVLDPSAFPAALPTIDRLSTGFTALDELLGGGFPKGRISELSGATGSGKSTLAFSGCLQVLARGQVCSWIGLEGSFWPQASLEAELRLERLLVIHLREGRAALRAAQLLLTSPGAVSLLVVDLTSDVRPRDAQLQQLFHLAERSGTALLFLTERSGPAVSLGAAVALHLYVRRAPGARLSVEVLRHKGGPSQQTIEENVREPDRLRLSGSL